MNASLQFSTISQRPFALAAALTLLVPSMLMAQVTTYTDETAYQVELLRLGYSSVIESFEDDGAWGSVRSTISDGTMKAPSVTSQGITWTHNFPNPPSNSNGITTGPGAARTGNWGLFASPHGNYLSAACTVPGDCGDGFKGSTPAGVLMFAVGGWISTNTPPAQVGAFLDGSATVIDFGDLPLTPPNSQRFFGVIDTGGFNQFEFREMEGTKEDAKFIFADDFTIGLPAAGCGANTPPTAAFTFVQTDPDVAFTSAGSDTDGTVVQWLWDFGDGNSSNQQDPSHTYLSNGTYSVVHYVRDDGNCAAESAPQMMTVTSYPPADIAITNPTNGAVVSGTITLEVDFVDPPSAIEQVTYFLDDDEFDNSEADPFSLDWDTTGTTDGVHTLVARLTRFDETEILSDPVTFTVANAPPPTPLETWRGEHFSAADLADSAKEATVWGNNADPDGDCNSNWFEYVFGGIPTTSDATSIEPEAEKFSGPGGQIRLQISYNRRTNDPSLLYTAQVSSNLSSFFSGLDYVEQVSATPVAGTHFERVVFRDRGNLPDTDRVFGLVSVTDSLP